MNINKSIIKLKLVVSICNLLNLCVIMFRVHLSIRRRIYLDAKPERAQKKAENDRKGKITQRQKAVSNNCVQCTAKKFQS